MSEIHVLLTSEEGESISNTDDVESISRRYRAFADTEARGVSPTFEAWARAVAVDQDVLSRLATLPDGKRQPNLVFAALRQHHAVPGDAESLRRTVRDQWDDVAAAIGVRSTQTNEPGRCAVLLPLLHRLPPPIALVELGAAAGLCLLLDRYSYRYSDGTEIHPVTGPSDVLIECEVASGSLPPDLTMPDICWRAGLDLQPLDPADPDTAAWLTALVWPEHDVRRHRLAAALRVAAQAPAPVQYGDLRRDLHRLLDQAPPGATPVILHSATLAYLGASDRLAAAAAIAGSGAQWISFESRGVVAPRGPIDAPVTPDTLFVAQLNGEPVALSDGHGRRVTLL